MRTSRSGKPQVSVQELISQIVTVVKTQPIGSSLLSSTVPASSANITTESFLEKHDEIKSPTTIEQKVLDGSYNKDIHLFYHDIKLATTYALVQLPIGSEKYKELYSFFRFITDLILRESERLGHFNADSIDSPKDKKFESDVFNGYRKIVTDVKEWFGESYFIVSQNSGPLFTSVNGKASIDPRDTETHGQFNTTKLLPQVANHITPYQLGFVSPSTATVPHPAVPPTEILRDFVHPTKSALPNTKWIKFDNYASFAPAIDSNAAVFNDTLGGSIIVEKLTKKEEDKKKNQKDENAQAKERSDEDAEMEDVKSEVKERDIVDPNDEIDLLSVFQWSPGNIITDEELDAHSSGKISAYISKLLLQLQFLQNLRLSSNDGSEFIVTEKERELSLQVQNLIARMAADYTPKELDLQISSNMPVLSVNYQGTLPGTDRSIQPQARLTSMARPQTRIPKYRR